MVKRTVADLKPYNAPGHFNMVAMRIHGKEETGAEKFWIGVSTFLPGGGAEWAYEDNPLEKVYYILEGEMTVTDKDGKAQTLTDLGGGTFTFVMPASKVTITAVFQEETAEILPTNGKRI